MALKVKIIKEIPFNGVGNLEVSKTQVVVIASTNIYDAQVNADKLEVQKLTQEVREAHEHIHADHEHIHADKVNVQANTDKVQSLTNENNTIHAHIEADKTAVTGMRDEVEADRANVQTNTNTVNTLTAEVRTAHEHIHADKATVASDKANVQANKNAVQTMHDEVERDRAQVATNTATVNTKHADVVTKHSDVVKRHNEINVAHEHIHQDKADVTTMKASVEASEDVAIAKATIATTKANEAATSASKALAEANRAEAEADRAEKAAAAATGSLIESGSCDLSGGKYPAPNTDGNGVKRSCFWKVVKGGVVDGIDYGVNDTLVYSNTMDAYYKIDNTESVTSVNGMKGVVNLNAGHVGAYSKSESDSRFVNATGDDITGNLRILSGSQINHAFETTSTVSTYRFDAPYWRIYAGKSDANQRELMKADGRNGGVVDVWNAKAMNPTQLNHAAALTRKDWTEATFVKKAGDTMTGRLLVTGMSGGNNVPITDQIKVDGYGIIGNRAAFYMTNGNTDGNIQFGIGGAHSAATKLTVNSTRVESAVHLYEKGQRVYSPNNKPSASDVGAVNKAGDTMTGNLTFLNDSKIAWSRNTDGAEISFKNTSDADTDSYMRFNVLDNGNEYFKWTSQNGAVNSEWLSLKSDGLRVKGNLVYHAGNKPTWSDIGGTAYASIGSDTYIRSAARWNMCGGENYGWMPYASGSGSSAVSFLGNSSWWFKESWVHSMRGTNLHVDNQVQIGSAIVRKTSSGDLEFLV